VRNVRCLRLSMMVLGLTGCRLEPGESHPRHPHTHALHLESVDCYTGVHGIVTERRYVDETGEMPMIRRLYSKEELDKVIRTGMAMGAVVAELGNPASVTSCEDGTKHLQFCIDPQFWDRSLSWQLTGFFVSCRSNVVLGWKVNQWGGTAGGSGVGPSLFTNMMSRRDQAAPGAGDNMDRAVSDAPRK
jgi:hypothetical protein